eukprot:CAMPEP_0119030382 /NCGR_PEP_ID=MMETSP1176-20130426/41002_1 /TAXON_ID=265551 /ORGANISM="Synedropsis recta cf, Strain CCMP1620" /LENGTH=55 /DNA_ID=CAMNT_0006986751 /DNA_START=405 /DNA_END=572 /DNA_ORIENTATION=-
MYRNETIITAEKDDEQDNHYEEEGDEAAEEDDADEVVQVNKISQNMEALTELVEI